MRITSKTSARGLGTCVALATFSLLVVAPSGGDAIDHGFDTVNDMLFGWLGPPYSDDILSFYAKTYPLIVIGGSDPGANASDPNTYDGLTAAKALRKLNPNLKILLYEATGWGALVLGIAQLKEHPEWWLKDDDGKPYLQRGTLPQMDWRVSAARKWWVEMVMEFKDGVSLFDGLLVDSAGPNNPPFLQADNHTLNNESCLELVNAKMTMLQEATDFFKQANGGVVVGNPTLNWGVVGYPQREKRNLLPETAHWDHLSGTLDEMYGAFGSQQQNGQFNASTMNISINALIQTAFRMNKTTLVRGYPGPCNVPFVQVNASKGAKILIPSWPARWNKTQPTTIPAIRDVMIELLPQALAPYLIIANRNTWWSYAWFYDTASGFYMCPEDPNSCLGPLKWYESFTRPLGNPLHDPVSDGAFIWSREYEHASVSIDIRDRTKSTISWK